MTARELCQREEGEEARTSRTFGIFYAVECRQAVHDPP